MCQSNVQTPSHNKEVNKMMEWQLGHADWNYLLTPVQQHQTQDEYYHKLQEMGAVINGNRDYYLSR